MCYISFNYSSLHRFRQAILGSYMVNVGLGVTSRNGKNRTLRPIERRQGADVALFDLLVLPPVVVSCQVDVLPAQWRQVGAA